MGPTLSSSVSITKGFFIPQQVAQAGCDSWLQNGGYLAARFASDICLLP